MGAYRGCPRERLGTNTVTEHAIGVVIVVVDAVVVVVASDAPSPSRQRT